MTPLEIAISQLGKEEVPRGSNWGRPVQDYLASVGINFPASWCMAFVYWCVNEWAHISSHENPLVKTGGVLAQWHRFGGERLSKEYPELLRPGDIFIMDFGAGLGHTGFIESVEGDILHTIDGNTNDSGSREGYEVCRKKRSVSKCVGFIRPFNF